MIDLADNIKLNRIGYCSLFKKVLKDPSSLLFPPKLIRSSKSPTGQVMISGHYVLSTAKAWPILHCFITVQVVFSFAPMS